MTDDLERIARRELADAAREYTGVYLRGQGGDRQLLQFEEKLIDAAKTYVAAITPDEPPRRRPQG